MSSSKWVLTNKVKLWTESFGSKGDPAILYIVGAGALSVFENTFHRALRQNFVKGEGVTQLPRI